MKKHIKIAAAVLAGVFILAACASPAPAPTPAATPAPAAPAATPEPATPTETEEEINYPTRDITVVVPWGAGGGTDLTVRSLAEQMQGPLGTNMPILNMGGAGGSIGLQDVFDSARDGYRILGTSMTALATAQIMGLADVSHTEWYAWNSAFTPNAIVVRADSPYETLQDLIDAMAANPGGITMGSAGPGSSAHVGGVIFAENAGVTFNHIPYEGGNAAIIATLGGEVVFNAQLLSELIDHVRSGDLRALATLSDEAVEVIGRDGEVIIIPSAGNYVDALRSWLPLGGSFGIMVPRDTPAGIVNALNEAYAIAVQTDAFHDFADDRGMVVVGMDTVQTDQYLANNAARVGWTLYDAGLAPNSPGDFGISRP